MGGLKSAKAGRAMPAPSTDRASHDEADHACPVEAIDASVAQAGLTRALVSMRIGFGIETHAKAHLPGILCCRRSAAPDLS
ncbi:hypothetical protein SAMN06295900_116136 [Trinickia caryophylli]|uniref:Uncharacterized protein n=1 Tax=Trinickia caryophylli TaxID=28094 RepID=A0A1X7GKT3_TRICW|nr:hypothetical protein C0Z17_26490 [Trinickia caryophylli]SMF71266.1 hypothetical protein SAMN06295900_116136 [Trinickia caryophylli]